jgi:hypothetical protein
MLSGAEGRGENGMDQAFWYKRICTHMRMGLFVGPAKNLSESTALIDDDEKKQTNKRREHQEAGEFSESRPA